MTVTVEDVCQIVNACRAIRAGGRAPLLGAQSKAILSELAGLDLGVPPLPSGELTRTKFMAWAEEVNCSTRK
ncbi:MAG TPA: hypothetical protein VK196_03300 [Magnetospirillum sp.]|nr:hypothetical protein [Magnetospirillum sp.]